MFDEYSPESYIYSGNDRLPLFPNTFDLIFGDAIAECLLDFSSDDLISLGHISPLDLVHSYDTFDNSSRVVENDQLSSKNESKAVVEDSPTGGNSIPRKRRPSSSFSKKDRHSKIDTAQGPRDRRMRLNREVAREFFGLQDMLGVDKPSKAIEWLLVQSTPAIEALASTTGCKVTSGICDGAKQGRILSKNKKMRRQTHTVVLGHNARESREKARARAKQRMREKMLVRTLETTTAIYGEPKYSGSPTDSSLGSINHTLMLENRGREGSTKTSGFMEAW